MNRRHQGLGSHLGNQKIAIRKQGLGGGGGGGGRAGGGFKVQSKNAIRTQGAGTEAAQFSNLKVVLGIKTEAERNGDYRNGAANFWLYFYLVITLYLGPL